VTKSSTSFAVAISHSRLPTSYQLLQHINVFLISGRLDYDTKFVFEVSSWSCIRLLPGKEYSITTDITDKYLPEYENKIIIQTYRLESIKINNNNKN
jgi:hypothetical protein